MYISLNKKHSVVFIYGSIYVEEESRGTSEQRGEFSQVTNAKSLCFVG